MTASGAPRTIRDKEHPDHADMVEWRGGRFDPADFDAEAVNRAFHGRHR
jgi:hypothetical protein